MQIGGFQPLTLSDYPGRVAAIVFTQGCNFRCPFCHNGTLLAADAPAKSLLDEATVLETLRARQTFLDGVVLSGGEPTLQPDLGAFIATLKQLGLLIKLDTNGTRPDIIRDLLDRGLLDYVAMDIKAPPAKYAQLAGAEAPCDRIEETVRLLIASETPCEFRTTFVPGLLTKSDLEVIRAGLPRDAKYTVQRFIPDNALDASLRQQKTASIPSIESRASTNEQDTNDYIPHHIDWLSGE